MEKEGWWEMEICPRVLSGSFCRSDTVIYGMPEITVQFAFTDEVRKREREYR